MRSSIACTRCRKSKIKCVNSGVETTCRACESSGRPCVYPTSTTGGGNQASGQSAAAVNSGAQSGTKRDREAVAAPAYGDKRSEWEGGMTASKKQRSRKNGPGIPVTVNGDRVNLGAKGAFTSLPGSPSIFNSSILTIKEWENIFELYQMHFATILPFLQPTSYRAQVRQICDPVQLNQQRVQQLQSQSEDFPAGASNDLLDKSMNGDDSPVTSLVLIGVLALTARFHAPLIKYHAIAASSSEAYSHASFASEVYANKLRNYFSGPDSLDMNKPVMSRVQALLMLSLHEWGMCRGKQAWMYTGMAIRMALASDLSYEDAEDTASQLPQGNTGSKATAEDVMNDGSSSSSEGNEAVIDREVRRRTLWACFMLDRLLACGSKQRPRMLKVRDMNVQLPSDNAFMFGERVRSNHLNCWPKGPTAEQGRASTERDMTSRQRERAGTTGTSINQNAQSLPSLRQSLGLPDEKGRSPAFSSGAADGRQQTWAASSGTSSASSPDTPPRTVSANNLIGSGPGGPGNVNILNDSEERPNTEVDRFEVGVDECVLGRVIRMLRISTKIGRWVSRKRSKKDDTPSSVPAFMRLQNHLNEFRNSLSRNLQYSSRNTDIHMYSKSSLPSYALMHVMYFTSVMLLHRSALNFIPLQLREPAESIESEVQLPYGRQHTGSAPPAGDEGPPKLSDSGTDRENVEAYLRAAQQLLELVRGCYDREVMSESPLVGWGIYQACFAGIYTVTAGLVDAKKNSALGTGKYNVFVSDVCKAIEVLADMRSRLKMAETWFRTLHRLHSYYCRIQKELHNSLRNSEETAALEQTFLRFGSPEDNLQTSNAAAPRAGGNPPTPLGFSQEEGNSVQAAQASKSTPPSVPVQPDGACNLSDLATLAGTREPFATGSNSASGNNRSIAPLIPLAAAPVAVSQGPPAQAVGGENSQVERTWSGIAPAAKPESTPPSANHVYTLPPLQPSLCAVTQAPTSTSLLHSSTAAAAPPPAASSFPSASPMNPPPTSVTNVPTMAIPTAIAEADEVKDSQLSASLVIQGQSPAQTMPTRLQPLASWAPTSSVSGAPSLPPLLKSSTGPAPALGYAATAPVIRTDAPTSSQPGHAISTYPPSITAGEATLTSGRQLNTPPGMPPPPPATIQQSPKQPNLLPPIASTGFSHGLQTTQSQPAVQFKHHAPSASLSSAPPMIPNASIPRTTGLGSSPSSKPAGILLSDSVLSMNLGGDDALAFFEGAGWELFCPRLAPKKTADGSGQYPVGANGMSRAWLGGSQGLPSGWLALIWADTATS